MSLIVLLLLLLSSVTPFSFPQSFTIQGEVRFEGNGTVFVALVDRESFRKPEKGIAYLEFPFAQNGNENTIGPSKVTFSFRQVPAGTYAIICYLDANGNGKLDSSLFGPTEPWGMSFRGNRPRFRAPRFEDASFMVPENIRYFAIELGK